MKTGSPDFSWAGDNN